MNPMTIECPVQIGKEGDQFVAHAMSLHVMSCGGTPEEARPALDEAVGLFLKTSARQGFCRKPSVRVATKSRTGWGRGRPRWGFEAQAGSTASNRHVAYGFHFKSD